MLTLHTILFVADQAKSTEFYSRVLNLQPDLNVPGMTEFHLSDGAVLGLMPRASAERLFTDKVKIARENLNEKSAELYLLVDEAANYIRRAINEGAVEIDPLQLRDWGHRASYYLDPDGQIIAFAQK